MKIYSKQISVKKLHTLVIFHVKSFQRFSVFINIWFLEIPKSVLAAETKNKIDQASEWP